LSANEETPATDSDKLAGLFDFAAGLLTARGKTRLRVDNEKLGYFREQELLGLHGLAIGTTDQPLADDCWLYLKRLKPSPPPVPQQDHSLSPWLDRESVKSPDHEPALHPYLILDTTLDLAREMIAARELQPDAVEVVQEEPDSNQDADDSSDVEAIQAVNQIEDRWSDDQLPNETKVKVTLALKDNPAIEAEFTSWLETKWHSWVKAEKPIRRSISYYKKLFRLHTKLHSGDSSANELVFGVGIAEFGKAGSPKRLDIPLVEFLLDIDLKDDGAITLTPREVPPYLNLRPLMEAGLDGAEQAQPSLQNRFEQLKVSDEFELTPFSEDILDEFFTIVAGQISSDGEFLERDVVNNHFTQNGLPPNDPTRLRIHAGWVIYGRPRSSNFRVEDLQGLRERLTELGDSDLPDALGGFVQPIPDAFDDDGGTSNIPEYPDNWGDYVVQKHAANNHRYYFPLASNEEQNHIVKKLEEYPVVTVTGPPGTGKTHSIANIVAHYMATGRRVLVTARTAEAIAAVQDKLPERLSSLVIASVASDREGTRQLESAIKKLSDEVLQLNDQQLESEISQAERAINDAENQILDCEKQLAHISQLNLTPLRWQGQETTVMELSETLSQLSDEYDWFLDRPESLAAQPVTDAVDSIKTAMANYPDTVGYVGQHIPTAEEIPSNQSLIEYHLLQNEVASMPKEDFSNEPTMAVDNAESHTKAKELEEFFSQATDSFARVESWHFNLCSEIMSGILLGTDTAILGTIDRLHKETQGLTPARIEIDYHGVEYSELLETLDERKNGKKASIFGGLFSRQLNDVVDAARIDGGRPGSSSDWQQIIDWIEIDKKAHEIRAIWEPCASSGSLPGVPATTHELATQVSVIKGLADKAKEKLPNIAKRKETFDKLFPYGIDSKDHFVRLDFARLGRALRANLNLKPEQHPLKKTLENLGSNGSQPLFRMCRELNEMLHIAGTDQAAIVEKRNTISTELHRLQDAGDMLKDFQQNLQMVDQAGASALSETIGRDCVNLTSATQVDAADIVAWKDHWHEAWEWAVSRRELDRIVELGNGDEIRSRKQQFVKDRESRYLQLLEAKTRAGLKKRMTPRIRSEFQKFTQAIGRLGSGTGKSAYRYRRIIKDAARNSSSAVPVWIMPEDKVCEQLPVELGMFDLVILDEASQSDITSLGVLSRGKKLLIVGDEEQVSPSAVGVTIERVDLLRSEYLRHLPNRDSYDEKMSIFDMAMQRYPESHLMLREHFRCVHPIIEFSTRFYNGRLVPLRVPKTSERFDPPLVDVHIKGSQRDGKINEAEANFIVEEIAAITANPEHRERDIAVISLIGGEQADHIERLLMDDPRIGTEVIDRHKIVCGDSRTMQGQERSIVFLSMVAVPGNARTQRKREDRQRFNVAMSRARDREYIVRSVASADLNTDDLKNEVIQHFKEPLKDGRSVVGIDVLERCDSGFERDVCKRLLDAGYRVRSQVAAGYYRIDLVVEGDNDTRLAVELDGDRWHGPDKWDADTARQSALERAGWRFWRVFGSQWYGNKEHHWESLLSALKEENIEPIGGEAIEGDFTEFRVFDVSEISALGATAEQPLQPDPTAENEINPEEPLDDEPEELTQQPQPLEVMPPKAVTTSDVSIASDLDPVRFYDEDYQGVLTNLVLDIIDSAGPINFDDLAVRVARKHDFSRTGRKIRDAVKKAIDGERALTNYADTTEVLWPSGMEPTKAIPFRGLHTEGVERDWDLLPWPEKIGLAQKAVVENPNQPVDTIMATLQITRAGQRIRAEFDAALAEAEQVIV